jgi:hypothetical protein
VFGAQEDFDAAIYKDEQQPFVQFKVSADWPVAYDATRMDPRFGERNEETLI